MVGGRKVAGGGGLHDKQSNKEMSFRRTDLLLLWAGVKMGSSGMFTWIQSFFSLLSAGRVNFYLLWRSSNVTSETKCLLNEWVNETVCRSVFYGKRVPALENIWKHSSLYNYSQRYTSGFYFMLPVMSENKSSCVPQDGRKWTNLKWSWTSFPHPQPHPHLTF